MERPTFYGGGPLLGVAMTPFEREMLEEIRLIRQALTPREADPVSPLAVSGHRHPAPVRKLPRPEQGSGRS